MKKIIVIIVGVLYMATCVGGNFTVVGIATRTSNDAEFKRGAGKLMGLWQRFFQENVLANISHKVDDSIVVVYYDYESDYKGEYSYLIGAKVTDTSHIPEGMIIKEVPAGMYQLFTTEKGPVQQVEFVAWSTIWSLEEAGKLDRAYHIDYEIHDEKALDPENAQIDIYIGVRS